MYSLSTQRLRPVSLWHQSLFHTLRCGRLPLGANHTWDGMAPEWSRQKGSSLGRLNCACLTLGGLKRILLNLIAIVLLWSYLFECASVPTIQKKLCEGI